MNQPAEKTAPLLDRKTISGTNNKTAVGTAQPRDDHKVQEPDLRLFLSEKDGALAACQISAACMEFTNGRQIIYVPDAYQNINLELRKCLYNPGWPYIKYYNESSSPRSKNRRTRTYDFDLIGFPFNAYYYRHFAHFIPEFITNNMVPFSMFSTSSYPRNTRCISHIDGQRRDCADEERINPKIAFSPNILGSKRGWNHAFVNLLLKRSNLLYPNIPEYKPNAPLCFRSVLLSPQKFNSRNKVHDALFRNAGIKRRFEMKEGKCRPKIVLIVRDSSKKLDRTIPRGIIDAFLKEIPDIEVVQDMGKLPLEGQMHIIQGANILICVHGAELSNLVFLRERTRVIEIFPFGYYYGHFNSMYKYFNVRSVRRISAKPDTERFFGCVKHRAKRKDFSQELKENFLTEYHKEIAAKNDKSVLSDYRARACARTQRIYVDPKVLTRITREEARQFCNQ